MAKATEKHKFIVFQILLITNNALQGLKLWVRCTLKLLRTFNDSLNLSQDFTCRLSIKQLVFVTRFLIANIRYASVQYVLD